MNPTKIARVSARQISGDEPPKIPGGRGGPVMNRVNGYPVNPWNFATNVNGIRQTTDIAHYFLNAKDKVSAVNELVKGIVSRWNEVKSDAKSLDKWTADEVFQFTLEICNRYIKGAIGEMYVSALLKARNTEILPEKNGDESAGIDIRSPGFQEDTTHQVKTTESWDNAQNDKKNADYTWVVLVDSQGNVKDHRKYKN